MPRGGTFSVTVSYIHTPTPRRRTSASVVDRVVDRAIVRLFRSAMDRNWTPYAAAPAIVSATGGIQRLLRLARVRVRSRLPDYPTEIGGRVLATLAVALEEAGEA